jgi:hypothetical protein
VFVSLAETSSLWIRFIPVVNLLWTTVPIIFLGMTWHSFLTFGDDDFAALFSLALLVCSAYYGVLIRWAIQIVARKAHSHNKLGESLVLFLFTWVPILILVFFYQHT